MWFGFSFGKLISQRHSYIIIAWMPAISKWPTSNQNTMNILYFHCKSTFIGDGKCYILMTEKQVISKSIDTPHITKMYKDSPTQNGVIVWIIFTTQPRSYSNSHRNDAVNVFVVTFSIVFIAVAVVLVVVLIVIGLCACVDFSFFFIFIVWSFRRFNENARLLLIIATPSYHPFAQENWGCI